MKEKKVESADQVLAVVCFPQAWERIGINLFIIINKLLTELFLSVFHNFSTGTFTTEQMTFYGIAEQDLPVAW